MRQVLSGLHVVGLLLYKTTLTVQPIVIRQMFPGQNLARSLQYKITFKVHPTVNETLVSEA